MPLFDICLKADLQGIAKITPVAGRFWRLKLACSHCHDEMPNFVDVDPNESIERDGGVSNAMVICKNCKAKMSVSVVPKSDGCYIGGLPTKVITVDCRGCEPVVVDPAGVWLLTGAEGREFPDQEIGGKEEWTDYDEDTKEPVSVDGVELSIARSKSK